MNDLRLSRYFFQMIEKYKGKDLNVDKKNTYNSVSSFFNSANKKRFHSRETNSAAAFCVIYQILSNFPSLFLQLK